MRSLGDRLIILGLIDRRVDLRQHETLVDVLPLLEENVDQLSVDLRADRDGVERLHAADAVEVDRHIGGAGRGGERRNRLIALTLKPASLWGALGPRLHHNCRDRGGDHQDHQTGDNAPLELAPARGGLFNLDVEPLNFVHSGLAPSTGGQPPPSAWNKLTTASNRARRTCDSKSWAVNKVCSS